MKNNFKPQRLYNIIAVSMISMILMVCFYGLFNIREITTQRDIIVDIYNDSLCTKTTTFVKSINKSTFKPYEVEYDTGDGVKHKIIGDYIKSKDFDTYRIDTVSNIEYYMGATEMVVKSLDKLTEYNFLVSPLDFGIFARMPKYREDIDPTFNVVLSYTTNSGDTKTVILKPCIYNMFYIDTREVEYSNNIYLSYGEYNVNITHMIKAAYNNVK